MAVDNVVAISNQTRPWTASIHVCEIRRDDLRTERGQGGWSERTEWGIEGHVPVVIHEQRITGRAEDIDAESEGNRTYGTIVVRSNAGSGETRKIAARRGVGGCRRHDGNDTQFK